MALTLVITDAGRAALVNARNDGTNAVRIASAGVSATAIVASAAATTLPGETKRVATVSGSAVARDVIHLVVQDETMDSYTLRSFALYLDNGVLFALYGQPAPIIEKSAQALMLLAVDVTLQDVAAGQITFGDANFLQPPATTDRPGVVELATEAEAAAGTDRSRAITPYTLRVTYGDVWRASNDGSGSGLDADLLDGYHASHFAPISGAAFTGAISSAGAMAAGAGGGGYVQMTPGNATFSGYVSFFGADGVRRSYLGFAPANGATLFQSENGAGFALSGGPVSVAGTLSRGGNGVWDAGNDGAGSGLDADLLDGRQGADFALLSGAPFTGPISSAGTMTAVSGGGYVQLVPGNATFAGYVGFFGANGTRRSYIGFPDAAGPTLLQSDNGAGFSFAGGPVNVTGSITRAGNVLWDAANDGAGSGLDADLLDGHHGAWYADIAARLGYTPVQAGTGIGQLPNIVKIGWTGSRLKATIDNADMGAIVFENNVVDVWRASNDGAGSGLDADLLDGRHGAEYALLSGAAFTGPLSCVGTMSAVAGGGYVQLVPGNANFAGYVAFFGSNGTRRSYIGFPDASGPTLLQSDNGGGFSFAGGPVDVTGTITRAGNLMWDAANDGAGSGLDADLLDGWHRDDIRRWGNLLDMPGAFPPAGHTHSAADISGAFTGSLSENGYTVLPNGLILQWVTGSLMGAGQETTQLVYFPVAFPNACFGVVASTRDEYFSRAADVMFSTIGAPATDTVTVGRKQFSGSADDQVASRPFIVALGR